jgi:dihydropteroate synthase
VADGVTAAQLVLDPGLGFAKDAGPQLALLAHLDELVGLGLPVLVAASRKRFLGHLLAGTSPGAGDPAPPLERDDATAAVSALAAAAGAWCVRVHEVLPTFSAVRVAAAWVSARGGAR